jgi:hypothetical protein
MTLLNIELTTPAADGSLTPALGVLRFTPTQRRTVDGVTVLPAPFTEQLVLGIAAVELEPTTLAWVWRIDEHVSGSPARTIYAAIPDQSDLDYTALIPIDPATLAPAPSLDPAWLAALTELSAATITPDPDDPGFFLIGAS